MNRSINSLVQKKPTNKLSNKLTIQLTIKLTINQPTSQLTGAGGPLRGQAAAVPAAAPTRGARHGGHGMRATAERIRGNFQTDSDGCTLRPSDASNFSHCVQQFLGLLEEGIRGKEGRRILATFVAPKRAWECRIFGTFSTL